MQVLHINHVVFDELNIICYLTHSMQKAFTAERREQLKQLSQMPDIYERLARALGMCLYVCSIVNMLGCI